MWICVAYSAPVAAATAVFLIYPIGQGSFSDGEWLAVPASWRKSCLNRGKFRLRASKSPNPLPNPTLTVGELLDLVNVEGFPNTLPKGVRGFSKAVLKNNPLRNSILNLPVKEINISKEDGTLSITNKDGLLATPGIYILHNPNSDKFWVGEAENVYERLRKHLSELRTGKCKTPQMMADFTQNSNGWRAYYYADLSVPELKVRSGRIPIESMIQRCCCVEKVRLYNLQIQNPVEKVEDERSGGSKSEFKKVPGVLEIRCVANNKVWYGQGSSLSQKRSQLLQKLKNPKRTINEGLYNDWQKYGPDQFIFTMKCVGPEYSETFARVQKVDELIEKTPYDLRYNE